MERVTDNFNLDFPAIMADGRQFTDYRSNCILNKMSKQMTSQEYKNYLINNTSEILSNQSKINEQLMGCKSCSDYSIVPPFLSLNCNGNQCRSFVNDIDGIGIARSSIPTNKEGFTVGAGGGWSSSGGDGSSSGGDGSGEHGESKVAIEERKRKEAEAREEAARQRQRDREKAESDHAKAMGA